MSLFGTKLVKKERKNNTNSLEEFVKFHVPLVLKEQLQTLAQERNISLSALMRLIATDYLKRNQHP